MKEIVMADHAGFCFGVKRAVDAIVNALADRNEKKDKKENREPEVWTIGLPIHNPQEVERLCSMGLKVARDESEIPAGAKVLIRAHGESLAVLNALRDRGMEVTETTCPFVSRAQELAGSLSEEGYYVVLLGDRDHPEIRGIMGHVRDPLKVEVIADESEAGTLALKLKKLARIALISQTTQREERLSAVAGILTRCAGELHVCNTICRATTERQEAVRALEGRVDGVVLIGGRASANTGKLRDIAGACGLDVLWIEDVRELEENGGWFEGRNRIGIAAGASTPEWLIRDICSKIAKM